MESYAFPPMGADINSTDPFAGDFLTICHIYEWDGRVILY